MNMWHQLWELRYQCARLWHFCWLQILCEFCRIAFSAGAEALIFRITKIRWLSEIDNQVGARTMFKILLATTSTSTFRSTFRRLRCKLDGATERVVETLRVKVKELVTLGQEHWQFGLDIALCWSKSRRFSRALTALFLLAKHSKAKGRQCVNSPSRSWNMLKKSTERPFWDDKTW